MKTPVANGVVLLFTCITGCLCLHSSNFMELNSTVECDKNLKLELNLTKESISPGNMTSFGFNYSCDGNTSEKQNPTGTRGRRVVVNLGSNFTFTCHGKMPVKWDYNDELAKNIKTRQVSNSAVVLEVKNASYSNGGLFQCSSYEGDVKDSIYVFVKGLEQKNGDKDPDASYEDESTDPKINENGDNLVTMPPTSTNQSTTDFQKSTDLPTGSTASFLVSSCLLVCVAMLGTTLQF